MYKIDELVCSTNGYKHSGLELTFQKWIKF